MCAVGSRTTVNIPTELPLHAQPRMGLRKNRQAVAKRTKPGNLPETISGTRHLNHQNSTVLAQDLYLLTPIPST